MRAMDELNPLASLGLVLPSPAYIAGAILFGLIGYAAFRRGRKTSTASLTWTGVALISIARQTRSFRAEKDSALL